MAEEDSDTGEELFSGVIAEREVMGGWTDVEGSSGDISESPFAVEEVIFAVREFRMLVVVVGCPLLVDSNGDMFVGLTSVGESNKPSPPSLYLGINSMSSI
ncbi:hypothetical protein TNCT_465271 [Trichonephila clavata]|uniref:Uncharacterized protein n=1 Tax=Trichonephila clavata TaxID=2740835 RepID=A0A8X6JE87_TRICU|nr:hypothetical protein TNCT_465271 [Trichonephila clavata]